MKKIVLAKNNRALRVAFVSTSVAPYCIPARTAIDQDPRIEARHFFARKIEPGRQWDVVDLPKSFEIIRGTVLRLPGRFFYLPLGLPRALKQYCPDIIVSEQLGTLLIMTYFYSLLAGVPVLLRWEGTSHTERRFNGQIRKFFRSRLVALASGFFCYSSGARKYLESLGSTGPFYRNPYSVDESLYSHGKQKRNEKIFLFVGQIVERKGIRYLLKAFTKVLLIEPEAELWIAGDGPLRGEMERSLNKETTEKVSWLGFCNKDKLAKLFQTAGIFVCPTLEDHGPMVQIEAACSGLPIISTPFSGNAELVVESGLNGEIVDPRDSSLLANAMLKMIYSPDKEDMRARSKALGKLHTPAREAQFTISNILDFARSKYGDLKNFK